MNQKSRQKNTKNTVTSEIKMNTSRKEVEKINSEIWGLQSMKLCFGLAIELPNGLIT